MDRSRACGGRLVELQFFVIFELKFFIQKFVFVILELVIKIELEFFFVVIKLQFFE